ncbi:TlpA family protein disulfide reductase [Brevibacterium jeotgali]|uniref:Peroxiredoxin n=1 Tax=Brevibacterium jeotgali TaxID=1262550 RepID=A0A2H1L1M6_9MICO|nr:TlpA disulfide reductase family protein [Brevibacterium jeotgali]TWC02787.1 peroxiredoxin [Brevibacterium jeotgali]SMY10807.1 Peroxiredoxin [Brevibacterium jeotgali]
MTSSDTTRRALLRAGSLLAGASTLTLLGCAPSDDAVQGNDGGDQGYVSGAGVITQLATAERGEPIELAGEYTDGTPFNLTEWRGAPVVLNLWYAACPPCREEAPALQANYERFQDDDVEFLGINVRDQAPAADAFAKTFGLTFPSMLDLRGEAVMALAGVLPPQAVPSTVVLDDQGRTAARAVGAIEDSTLKALISDVLAEDS